MNRRPTHPTSSRRITSTLLASLVGAGLLVGTTACGGDDGTSSAEARALVEQLLDASRGGASADQIADLLAQADPEIISQVIPELENELDISIPDLPPPSDLDDTPSDAPDGSNPNEITPEGDGSDEAPQEAPSTTKTPVVTLPGGASPTIPSLPPPNLPTTKAPVVTLPGGVTPTLPKIPTPNIPSTSTAISNVVFDNVTLFPIGNQLNLEVILSVDGGSRPEKVLVRFRDFYRMIKSAWLTFEDQWDSNTSLWTAKIQPDADPCSFELGVPPSNKLYRFELDPSC